MNSHCGEWDPAAWATIGISNVCPDFGLGEVTQASQVFREDTTRKATFTGYKYNPVWQIDRRHGSFSSVEGIFAFQ